MTDRDALIERLPSLMEPDHMHPVGCSSWVDEAAAFISMVSDYLLASPSPAQWPSDEQVESAAIAMLNAEVGGKRSPILPPPSERELAMARAALATLPPPEDKDVPVEWQHYVGLCAEIGDLRERVKGLTDALHRIAHPYGETTFNDLMEIATTALASYRGGA